MAHDERTLNMDLPEAVADAAEEGDVDAVREWLANGGAPDANIDGVTLLEIASASSRPSCAVIAEILCAAGARAEGASGDEEHLLMPAALHGAVDTVKVLLRYGASVSATSSQGLTALHLAVSTNDWRRYIDPWSIDNAKVATSIGHQGVVRLLLKHGAAVNAHTASKRLTPLMFAAKFSGFISLGVVRELLAGGADLDQVDFKARNAEAIARHQLGKEIYTGEGIPEKPEKGRRPGAVEAFLALLADVRAAGSWKRYANEPRVQLIVLRKLAESGRAVATRGILTRLFAPRRRLMISALPDVLFWKILEFWRTDRDP
jgi:ankyrin repeat protein